MIDIDAFQKIVDDITDNITSIKEHPDKLCQYAGIIYDDNYTLKAVSAKIYSKINKSFSTNQRQLWELCRSLRKHLVLQNVLGIMPINPYLAVLDVIQDAVRSPSESLSGDDDWITAVNAAYVYTKLQAGLSEELQIKSYSREFSVARAALQLNKLGYQTKFENSRIDIDAAIESKLIEKIEYLIKTIGGMNVAYMIFSLISPSYNLKQERYHLVRRPHSINGNKAPDFPTGFLLQLAAKHPFQQKVTPDVDIHAAWAELMILSTAYAAIFDVQQYSEYELLFLDASSLIPFLQTVARYDTMFTIKQVRPGDAIKIASGLLEWLGIDQKFENQWSIKEVLAISNAVLNIGKSHGNAMIIDMDVIIKECKWINVKTIKAILNKILSHPTTGTNCSYKNPTDTPTFFQRPLLALGGNKYFLMNSSLCAPAVIESLFYPLRNIYKNLTPGNNFDEKVGYGIEKFLKKELEKEGVTALSGKYNFNGECFECDLIIETSKTIIFIEIKKKALTGQASTGVDKSILMDLTGSLLEAQFQAGRHELNIRRDGYIDLLDSKEACNRINLGGRNIERIAVSLFDYGGFQDRLLLKHFLEIGLNVQYNPIEDNPNIQHKFDKLNATLEKLREQVKQLQDFYQLEDTRPYQPFFHCWFLSVPQILVLLDSVTNNEDFESSLRSTRGIHTGSMDFYFDYARINPSI